MRLVAMLARLRGDRSQLGLVAALSLVLVACGGGGGGGESFGSGASIVLRDCENLGGNFAVPFEEAQASLPAGFEPVGSAGANAVFYVIGVRCASGTLDGQELGPSQIAYGELAAIPPGAAAVAGIGDYTVPILFTATPDALAAAFVDLHLGQVAPGTVEWTEPTGGLGTQVTFTVGDATVTLSRDPAGQPAAPLGGGDFALFGVQNLEVLTTVLGAASGATAVRTQVALDTTGGPALLDSAASGALGFAVSGFDLAFTLVAP